MRQYKDDLLASCLQLLLSLPNELVECEIDTLVPALQVRGGARWGEGVGHSWERGGAQGRRVECGEGVGHSGERRRSMKGRGWDAVRMKR